VSLEELRVVIIVLAALKSLRGFAHRLDVHSDIEKQDGFARFVFDGLAGRGFGGLSLPRERRGAR